MFGNVFFFIIKSIKKTNSEFILKNTKYILQENIILVDASIDTTKNNFYFRLLFLFEFFLNAIKFILIHESIYTTKIKLYSHFIIQKNNFFHELVVVVVV